jgi:hypothetical protein
VRRRHAVEPVLLARQRQPAGFHQLESLERRLVRGAFGKLGAILSVGQELLRSLVVVHGTLLLLTRT